MAAQNQADDKTEAKLDMLSEMICRMNEAQIAEFSTAVYQELQKQSLSEHRGWNHPA